MRKTTISHRLILMVFLLLCGGIELNAQVPKPMDEPCRFTSGQIALDAVCGSREARDLANDVTLTWWSMLPSATRFSDVVLLNNAINIDNLMTCNRRKQLADAQVCVIEGLKNALRTAKFWAPKDAPSVDEYQAKAELQRIQKFAFESMNACFANSIKNLDDGTSPASEVATVVSNQCFNDTRFFVAMDYYGGDIYLYPISSGSWKGWSWLDKETQNRFPPSDLMTLVLKFRSMNRRPSDNKPVQKQHRSATSPFM